MASQLTNATRSGMMTSLKKPLAYSAIARVTYATAYVRAFATSSRVVTRHKVPRDAMRISAVRSSGKGGQNVNKLNTKVEARFTIAEAAWLPDDVKQRLARSPRVNKLGEMIVTSQASRSQKHNLDDCFVKMQQIVDEASISPKERKLYKGESNKGKERRMEKKRRRSEVKSSRRPSRDEY